MQVLQDLIEPIVNKYLQIDHYQQSINNSKDSISYIKSSMKRDQPLESLSQLYNQKLSLAHQQQILKELQIEYNELTEKLRSLMNELGILEVKAPIGENREEYTLNLNLTNETGRSGSHFSFTIYKSS